MRRSAKSPKKQHNRRADMGTAPVPEVKEQCPPEGSEPVRQHYAMASYDAGKTGRTPR